LALDVRSYNRACCWSPEDPAPRAGEISYTTINQALYPGQSFQYEDDRHYTENDLSDPDNVIRRQGSSSFYVHGKMYQLQSYTKRTIRQASNSKLTYPYCWHDVHVVLDTLLVQKAGYYMSENVSGPTHCDAHTFTCGLS
jgi:hypothetical protein